MSPRRALTLVALAAASARCTALVGDGDFRVEDGASRDAATADGASGPEAGADGAPTDASRACADGGCASPGEAGLAAACTPHRFGYSPSNFLASTYAADVPPGPTTVSCDVTYTTPGGTGPLTWCGGPGPYVIPSVAQAGGPNVDILVFSGLTVNAGATLTLSGTDAVILAVYGDATIDGTIDASGFGGVAGNRNAATSGPGGNFQCGSSAGGNGPSPLVTSGGGGGGASGPGGAGGRDNLGSPGGVAGVARANPTLVPLFGGCPGGASSSCGQVAGGGGGGGAVQISAAGALRIAGSVLAAGGTGGAGAASGCVLGGLASATGGGGGGSGGGVLLEGLSVSGTGDVGGGSGGAVVTTGGGAGGSALQPAGSAGASNVNGGGGGGGGGYGYLRINVAPASAALVCDSGQAGPN